MNDKELQEIKTRWYKDPTLLASPEAVSRQAVTDIKALLSTIEGLKKTNAKLEEDASVLVGWHNREVNRLNTEAEGLKGELSVSENQYKVLAEEKAESDQLIDELQE